MRINHEYEINCNERCHWLLNRKLAEYISHPTPQLENTLKFLLTSYRDLNTDKMKNKDNLEG